jgi:[ribosomal protein S18]-alanine N-acetyltransferase
MTNLVAIREYETKDKNEVLNLIRLNTPAYFAADEEEDLNKYLETERELYYVLLYDKKLLDVVELTLQTTLQQGKLVGIYFTLTIKENIWEQNY